MPEKPESGLTKRLSDLEENQKRMFARLEGFLESKEYKGGEKPKEAPREPQPQYEEHVPRTPEEVPLPSSPLELAAREGPKEEVLLRTALGMATIRVNPHGHFALFRANLWTLDGEWDGLVRTVIQLEVDVEHEYTFPPRQDGSYDHPSHIQPVTDHQTPEKLGLLNKNRAKSKYTFKDDSTIEAVGVAVGYRVPMKDESFQIVVALTEAISYGTGEYDGVKGLATFVGGTWFPATPAFNDGERSEHRSFHTIRLFRKVVQGKVPVFP
jgi:hypothetical protein